MGLFSSAPDMVFFVEDHTDPAPKAHTVYWAHVYLSREKAKAGIETFAERGGHGPVSWTEHSPVSYAYPAHDDNHRALYKIIPLRVHPDNKPELP